MLYITVDLDLEDAYNAGRACDWMRRNSPSIPLDNSMATGSLRLAVETEQMGIDEYSRS
jgi:hypothetical protein